MLGIVFDRVVGGNTSNAFLDEFLNMNASNENNEFLKNLNLDKFYMYEGSMTDEPCFENLVFYLLDDV